MYLKRRRESVALAYRKTTKFLTSNTAILLKKMPNNKKNNSLPKVIEEYQEESGPKSPEEISSDDESHLGDQDLDYYLGIRPKDTYWSDPSGLEQIRKDYLIYHCGVSEEDYERRYKKKISKPSYPVQPKLKQVPFKIHKKHKKGNTLREGMTESWVEKKGLFKLFGNRRDSESTSDSYSECESNEEAKSSDIINIDKDDGEDWDLTEHTRGLSTTDKLKMLMGVRIKEVSEGRPCDNCPEICPGFVSHPWRKTCKSCGCDRLQHSVYHEELVSVRERLGLREGRGHSYDNNPPGLTAKQSELYWSSLGSAGGGAGGAAGRRSWRSRALAAQLPQQDLALAHCKHVDDAHRKQFEDFVAARNEIALDIGNALQHHGQTVACEGCTKSIRSGSIVIQAPRISEEAYFHPACFTCSECDELLVELAYCTLDGRLFCVRHYGERLKPRCHSCDELFISSPGVTSLHPIHPLIKLVDPFNCQSYPVRMGLLLSILISYVGLHEAIECMKHILSGIVPDIEPNFEDLVEYYTRLLQKTPNSSTTRDWITEYAQGYLNLKEDKDGRIKSAIVQFYNTPSNSTALLFSTKISSFGQDSLDENSQANGDYRSERYPATKTKTIISNTSESFSVGNKNRSSTSENISDPRASRISFDLEDRGANEDSAAQTKLTWEYRPKTPPPSPVPEIHFQPYSGDKNGDIGYSEEFLRSLDGIKFRPLQRNDPSGRRRSFKKRASSSSNSSRESRASREEELRIFTSLEEDEFKSINKDENSSKFGSAPNLAARSYSRSRSREKSRERKTESPIPEATNNTYDERLVDSNPLLKDAPKLSTFEEKDESNDEVTEEDFWANLGD